MNTFDLHTTGNVIERTGTGIERTGTGIERSGTGIERTGTGIERTGTGIARGLFVAMALAMSSVAPLALADSIEAAAEKDTIPARVDVREDAVSLAIGAPGCGLQGTGWQSAGYVRIPLAFSLDAGSSIAVSGSGSGDKVSGSGSGGKVSGSGSGDKVSGSGSGEPTAAQTACADLMSAFSIEVPDALIEGEASWSGVWGVAELALDGSDQAAVLVHPAQAEELGLESIALLAEITLH